MTRSIHFRVRSFASLTAKPLAHILPLLGFSLLVFFAISSVAVAQTTRRRTPTSRKTPAGTQKQQQSPASPTQASPTQQATPENRTSSTPTPASPVPIVSINNQTLTSSDLDLTARQHLEIVEQKIAEARRSVLELQINNTLLDVEAKKRRIDAQRLY